MRATLPVSLLLSALLAACASTKDMPASTHVPQNGSLKVDPALIGQPAPASLQQEAR